MSDQTKRKRLRGLKNLVADAVVHGSAAVEKVHLATTDRTFHVLEAIPTVDVAAKPIHFLHDLSVKGVYGAIRAVTAVVSGTLDVVLDQEAGKSDDAKDLRADDAPDNAKDLREKT
jgi:hypothetical protein